MQVLIKFKFLVCELTAGLSARAADPDRPFARNFEIACSARSALSSASSSSCCALRNLARFRAAISSCGNKCMSGELS